MSSAVTCTTPGLEKPFTVADLELAADLVRSMPPEPFGQWMRAQGCPPERWLLVLPASIVDGMGPLFLPSYVRTSSVLEYPVFLRKGEA